jgi:hypothetical protein
VTAVQTRTLIDDPACSDGLRDVRVTSGSTDLTIEVRRSGDGLARVRLDVESGRLVVMLDRADRPTRDLTCDPQWAVRSLFGDGPLPGLSAHLLDLAAEFSRKHVGELSTEPTSQLLLAGHPSLTAVLGKRSLGLPASLPLDESEMFKAPSVRSAVETLTVGRRPGRALLDAVAIAWAGTEVLRLRGVSMIRAGAALPDSQLTKVLEQVSEVEPWCTITAESARRCGAVFGRLGRSAHLQLMAEVVARRDGLGAMRLIAAADSTGLDLSGIRGNDRLDWLLTRAAEALERPLPGSPIGHLHGRRLDERGRRVRVVRSKAEFAHIASSMGNCLATYGPSATSSGSSIAVVVDEHGRPEQALEVKRGRVVQWAGPSNSAVPVEERQRVLRALTAATTVSSRAPESDRNRSQNGVARIDVEGRAT